MKTQQEELDDLEKEFQRILKGEQVPKPKINYNKLVDKYNKEFERDLRRENKKYQKQLLKEVKGLYKELKMTKLYKQVKKTEKKIKESKKSKEYIVSAKFFRKLDNEDDEEIRKANKYHTVYDSQGVQ